MNADLLLDNLAAIAAGPGGVDRLRELVLQLAVRGILIETDQSCAAISQEEVPYTIPSAWKWVRLGSIAQYNANEKVNPNQIPEDAWALDLEDIEKETSKLLRRVKAKERPSNSTKSRFYQGDVLFGKLRPYLNKVLVADADGYCTTEIVPIRVSSALLPRYLRFVLKGPDFLGYVNSVTYGVKMPRLGTADAINSLIPLPPLDEQHRIVEKVDRLMAFCDDLEARQRAEREGRRRLRTASFTALEEAATTEEAERAWAHVAGEFGRLVDTLEDVADLRKAMLGCAFHGHFSINQAKKSEKNWKVVTLKTTCQNIVDCPHSTPKWTAMGKFCLRSSDIKPGYIDFSHARFVDDATYEERIRRLKPDADDIVICREGTIGICAPIPDGVEVCLGQRILLLRPNSECSSKFLVHFLHSPDTQKVFRELTMGSTSQHVNVGNIRQMTVPLPPLVEQKEIVEKIDRLMALCDGLEAGIRARDAALEAFATAACRAVLGGAAPVSSPAAVTGTGQQRLPV